MIFIASRDAFGSFTFAAFSAKNIPVVVAVMISLSLIDSSMFFLKEIKTSHLLYRFFSSSDLKHMTSFWCLIMFSIDKLFIFRLKSVVCKKYTNTDDKDSKHTNAINISII